MLSAVGRLWQGHLELKVRFPSEAKSKRLSLAIVCRKNRTGGDHFNCSGQNGEGIELKGPAVTVEMREKLDK